MSEIKPALTAEEWANGYEGTDASAFPHRPGVDGRPRIGVEVRAHPLDDPADLHALAALALHGQPYGLTWEDVELLREQGTMERQHRRGTDEMRESLARHFESIADRIAALLPPRG